VTASALERVVAAAEPALAAYAVADAGRRRHEEVLDDPERSFVIEAVREGYLMHYGQARAYAGMDPDLCLLAGDAMYALGLSRLAELGDLEAVRVLADLISASAQAEVEGRASDVPALWATAVERLATRSRVKLAPGR
jgi:hypothetical protein